MNMAKAHNEVTKYKHLSTRKLVKRFNSASSWALYHQTGFWRLSGEVAIASIRANGLRKELESRGITLP